MDRRTALRKDWDPVENRGKKKCIQGACLSKSLKDLACRAHDMKGLRSVLGVLGESV